MQNFGMMRRTHFILLIAGDLSGISKDKSLQELSQKPQKIDQIHLSIDPIGRLGHLKTFKILLSQVQ